MSYKIEVDKNGTIENHYHSNDTLEEFVEFLPKNYGVTADKITVFKIGVDDSRYLIDNPPNKFNENIDGANQIYVDMSVPGKIR